MRDCSLDLRSENVYDLLIEYENLNGILELKDPCIVRIDEDLAIYYVDREGMPDINVSDYTYTAIPNCFSPLSLSALEEEGILRVQNTPTLGMKGNGVLIGFVDTGINYQEEVFRYSDGSSRIATIWDMTEEGDNEELFGRIYTKEEIDRALREENPLQIVPSQDENGHGTYLASIAAGEEDKGQEFYGVAPQSEIAVVKLKPAKQYLYDFWFLDPNSLCYQENDIILGIEYLVSFAKAQKRPLVICIALGSNMGSHEGSGPLSEYLDRVGVDPQIVVVVAAGNEAGARHHFKGDLTAMNNGQNKGMEEVEISIARDMKGVVAELWAEAPQLLYVSVVSPTGEVYDTRATAIGGHFEHRFVLEGTVVEIDYRIIGARRAAQLIFFRFRAPTAGLWNIYVYPNQIISGSYRMYLPMTQQLSSPVIYVNSDPNETITVPGLSEVVITVGGYDDKRSGLYSETGRGYTADGRVKPDFAAAAVDIVGIGRRGRAEIRTGTSAAAAITAGAAALYLEWAFVRENAREVNTVDVKNFLIRGARRTTSSIYPNREVGYGTLDLYRAFLILRL